MKVSVLICNYNYGDFLAQAIESVLAQTLMPCEIIVVDDGSTDNSRKILDCYLSNPIINIILKSNGGQASAFNAGMQKISGDIVAFLDSDDVWFPKKLECVVKTFLENSNAAMVQHYFYFMNKEAMVSRDVHPKSYYGRRAVEVYFSENTTNCFCPTSAVSIRTEVLKNIFPLPELEWRICADVPLTRPIPFFGEIVTLSQSLAGYRIHQNNHWSGKNSRERRLVQENKYVDYTNNFLAKLGDSRRIIHENSASYQYTRFLNHPRPNLALVKWVIWKLNRIIKRLWVQNTVILSTSLNQSKHSFIVETANAITKQTKRAHS